MEKTCLLSALLFFGANVIIIINEIRFRKHTHLDYSRILELDPYYIEEEYDMIIRRMPLRTAGQAANTAAWLFFTIPMMQVILVLSEGGKRRVLLHVAMAMLVLSGSTMEVMARLLSFGSYHEQKHIAEAFELGSWTGANEGWGWKTLEMLRVLGHGLFLWVDCFEFMALFLVLGLNFFSVRSTNYKYFGVIWADFGFIIALLACVDWIFNLLRIREWTLFSDLALIVAIVNRLVLLPVWLLMLGRQLGPAYQEYSTGTSSSGYDSGTKVQEQIPAEDEDPVVNNLELTESVPAQPQYTIDD